MIPKTKTKISSCLKVIKWINKGTGGWRCQRRKREKGETCFSRGEEVNKKKRKRGLAELNCDADDKFPLNNVYWLWVSHYPFLIWHKLSKRVGFLNAVGFWFHFIETDAFFPLIFLLPFFSSRASFVNKTKSR